MVRPECALWVVVSLTLVGLARPSWAGDQPPPIEPPAQHQRDDTYSELKREIEIERRQLAWRWVRTRGRQARRRFLDSAEGAVLARTDALMSRWVGTRWGLGPPQTRRPHHGKVNCGTFVALVLRDAGFKLNVWRWQLQSARRAVISLTPRRTRRYFFRAPIKELLAEVRRMGPGLYVIGLDFHIGFLRLDKNGGPRFIHASWIEKKVVDEPAKTAVPIVTSRHVVVGKILQTGMLQSWLTGRRIVGFGRR